MRRLFFLALLALVAGVGIVAVIESEPGYLLIAYGGYTVESSFWVGIVLIAAVVLLLYALLRFLHRLISAPSSVFTWASQRRLRQSTRLTQRGIVSTLEGNWKRGRRQLLRGAKSSEAPLLNYLLAARASHRLQEPESMREYLVLALKSGGGATVAVDLLEAEMQLEAHQYEKALKILKRGAGESRRQPQALHLLSRAYEGVGDAEALLALLPELRRYGTRPASELDIIEDRAYRSLLREAAQMGDADRLSALWKKAPERLKEDATAYLGYLQALIDCGEAARVGKVLEKALRQAWRSDLVNLYGRVPRESAQKPLALAEGWLRQHPDDPALLLCLGRLALQERLWQKARDYLERSHKLEPSEEACLELGRLLAAAGEHAAASAAFFTGVQLRSDKLPELPQPDDVLPGNHRLERDGQAG